MKKPHTLRKQTPLAITRSRKAWDRWYVAYPDQLWPDALFLDSLHGLPPMARLYRMVQRELAKGFQFMSEEYERLESAA